MVIAPTIQVANIGMADSLFLMVLALVVFGPRRLPQIGKQIGKLMYEFRKASNDFKFQMEEELRNSEEAERRQKEEAERQRRLAANPPAQIEAGTATETQASESAPAADSPSTSGEPIAEGTPLTYGEIAEAQEKATDLAVPTIRPPSTGETVATERSSAGIAQPQETGSPESAEADVAPSEDSVLPAHAQPQAETGQATKSDLNEGPLQHANDTAEEAEKTIEPAAHNG
jgi:sec-independent protein translocase protein TatB